MAIIRRNIREYGFEQDLDPDVIDTPTKIIESARLKGLKVLPLDIVGVAELLNIKIMLKPFEDDVSGMLVKNDDGTWTIFVNSLHHPNRQRYTIAHEIGHYCLHKLLKDKFEDMIFFRGTETNKEEYQANSFASELLMPENEFKRLLKEGVNHIEDLADRFEVSTLALRLRAKSLGMTGHGL